jgi:PAS domain S-box-containing protein
MKRLGLITLLLATLIPSIPNVHAKAVPPASSGLLLTAAEKNWLAAHRTIHVRISDAYPPFEFFADNRYQGMACDYLDVVARRLGVTFEPVSGLTWPESLAQLREKRGIDLILAITHTPERESSFAFTRDYLSFPQVVFSRKDGHFIAGIKELSGSMVAVERGFIMKEWLARDLPEVKFLEVGNSAEAMEAVSTNKADAYIQNLAVGTYLIDKLGLVNLKVAAPTPYGSDNLAMGVRGDWPELARLIDKALASITPEEHRAIHQRWLTIRFEHGIRPIDIVKWTGAVAGLALVWILLLRRMVRVRTAALREEIERRSALEEHLREQNDELAVIEEELRQQLDENSAAREEITKGHLLLQSVMDNTFQFQGLLTPDGVLVDVNRTALDFIGCGKDEVVGRFFWDTPWWSHDPAGQQELREAVSRAASGAFVRFESTHRSPDGNLHTIDVSLKAIRDETGRVIYLIPEGRDITERKRIQEVVAQSEEKFSKAFHRNPAILTISSLDDGRFIEVNETFLQKFGYTRDEVIGRTSLELRIRPNPEDRTKILELLDKFGSVHDLESNFVKKDGGTIVGLFSGEKIELNGEKCLISMVNDITDRKLAENALKEEKLFIETVIDCLPVFFYVRTGVGFVRWNRLVEEKFGLTPDELRNIPSLGMVYEEDKEYAGSLTARCLADGYAEGKVRLRLAQGVRNVFVTGKKMTLGDTNYIVGVAMDITEQVRTEDALKASEERFRQLFTQNDEAILLIDLNTLLVVDANPAALDLYGTSLADLSRQEPLFFVDRGDRPTFIEAIPMDDVSRAFHQPRMINYRKDGSRIIVSMWGKILHLKNDYIIYCNVRDITEKIRLEEEMKATQAKLIQTNKMTSLGLLVASVAHEINNPNTYISTNAEILARAWQDAFRILQDYRQEHDEFRLGGLPAGEMADLAPRLFNGIIDGSRRITEIINNMRDFVKTEKNNSHGLIEINKMLQAAASILWHHIHKYTDNFRLELPDSLPLARGSGQQIEQVVINLIMNALQALPDRTHSVIVRAASDRTSGALIISVQDEGKGMSREVLGRLAEPFFTTKINEGGTGLGLFISSSIIKEHGGTLEFESELGKGTQATICLPVAKANEATVGPSRATE